MKPCAIILAAGQGTRLKTQRPKVLHEVCGRPMLAYVLDACRAAGVDQCFVVVGYEKQQVQDAFRGDDGICWVEQSDQKGTGHAVMMAREQVAGRFEHALVLCGDGPLIRAETLRQVLGRHLEEHAAATLATAILPDPTGYGRILRDATGNLARIVEERDCSPDQRQIAEVNPSYYCFRVADLFAALDRIRPDNAKGEYYLTDTLEVLIRDGRKVLALTAVPPEDVFSINSRRDLALVSAVMRDRINTALMDAGVTLIDPATTWIDARARIGQDTVVHPFVRVAGAARVGCGCVIGPFANVPEGMVIPDGGSFTGSCGGGQ